MITSKEANYVRKMSATSALPVFLTGAKFKLLSHHFHKTAKFRARTMNATSNSNLWNYLAVLIRNRGA